MELDTDEIRVFLHLAFNFQELTPGLLLVKCPAEFLASIASSRCLPACSVREPGGSQLMPLHGPGLPRAALRVLLEVRPGRLLGGGPSPLLSGG